MYLKRQHLNNNPLYIKKEKKHALKNTQLRV